jgi:hypothetical protein
VRPTVAVTFNHNVGMLIMRRTYATSGTMCRPCVNRAMWYHTWRNLLFGWWGTISFFATPRLLRRQPLQLHLGPRRAPG